MRIIDSPGVVFDDDAYDDGKGNKKGSVLLRNVVKVEDIEDPIAVGESPTLIWVLSVGSDLILVEEIIARTPRETLQKIYNLPEFSNTLEFLTMMALSNGRLLKVEMMLHLTPLLHSTVTLLLSREGLPI